MRRVAFSFRKRLMRMALSGILWMGVLLLLGLRLMGLTRIPDRVPCLIRPQLLTHI